MRIAWVALVLAQASFAGTFNDQKRGFSFELPAEYQRLEQDDATRHVFFREVLPDEQASLVLLLSEKQLGQDLVLERSAIEAATRKGAESTGTHDLTFEYREVRWRQFTLEVMITRSVAQRRVGFTTRLPLANGVVTPVMNGPQSQEERLSAEFDSVIASFKGETNWETEPQRYERLGFYAGVASVPLCGLFSLTTLFFLLFRRRKSA